ncbi:hypothetical protein VCUG_02583 [Vavraia culicis subsp. floridensis]|uniref:Uncharacterized protein n=1 Tax=Vavraia culicis (isolate floridensis) TaxID=948595 RepID=L2GS79_VAVCU|nr:uncharacterized protein VCUG_02583 [Vavraia culicis subsp. floridensis]ELA45930.1 hypothetical protein VCUG_02583 [Vavraia culicis subsp. floridensis]
MTFIVRLYFIISPSLESPVMLPVLFCVVSVLYCNRDDDRRTICSNENGGALSEQLDYHHLNVGIKYQKRDQSEVCVEEQHITLFNELRTLAQLNSRQNTDVKKKLDSIAHLVHFFCSNLDKNLGKSVNEGSNSGVSEQQTCIFKMNAASLFVIDKEAENMNKELLERVKLTLFGYLMKLIIPFGGTFIAGKEEVEIHGTYFLLIGVQKELQIVIRKLISSSCEPRTDQNYLKIPTNELDCNTNSKNSLLAQPYNNLTRTKHQTYPFILNNQEGELAKVTTNCNGPSNLIFIFDPQKPTIYICASEMILIIDAKNLDDDRLVLLKSSVKNLFSQSIPMCDKDRLNIVDILLRMPLNELENAEADTESCCQIEDRGAAKELEEWEEFEEFSSYTAENPQHGDDKGGYTTTPTGLDDNACYNKLFGQTYILRDDFVPKERGISKANHTRKTNAMNSYGNFLGHSTPMMRT